MKYCNQHCTIFSRKLLKRNKSLDVLCQWSIDSDNGIVDIDIDSNKKIIIIIEKTFADNYF